MGTVRSNFAAVVVECSLEGSVVAVVVESTADS